DALARVWSALTCPTSGEVLLSAAPGYEFVDWGGQAHVGGGSHGSLHASDSLGALILTGVALPEAVPAQWAIRDVAPLVLRHFGLDASS
ncbi:MAG TPA: alkaline phosphatase family protein, partial [Solirubrobacteraceae bacterium]|nr:alkaline phosphatase family protein [Solirubrobacteraceae bacterium]